MTNINTKICFIFVLLFATQHTFAQSKAQETHGLQMGVIEGAAIEPGTIFLDGYETCTCEDELACTLDICLNDGSCGIIISVDSCLIDGACFGEGDFKSEDEQYSCQPGIDPKNWTASCPVEGTTCNANDANCTYGDTICECNGFGDDYTWQCYTCPQNQPSSGDACTDFGSSCNYGNTNCFCSAQTDQWICF